MSAPNPNIKPSQMVFVGGVPHDMSIDEYMEEVDMWPGVLRRYYRGTGHGWGNVTFVSNHLRDQFLLLKNKHVLGNKKVDVKAFEWKNRDPSPQQQPEKALPEAAAKPPLQPQYRRQPGLDNSSQSLSNCQTGTIERYISPQIGLLKTTNHGSGFFHAEVVFLCGRHGVACKEANCADYTKYTSPRSGRGSLFELLPVLTSVNFVGRPVSTASPEVKFQATMMWPQQSKKPSAVEIASNAVSDEKLIQFNLLQNGKGVGSLSMSSKVVGAGRPIVEPFPKAASSASNGETLAKGEDDVDSVLHRMMAIKGFLMQTLGGYEELQIHRMALTNRLMAIKDEDEALTAIFDCLRNNKINVDEGKRASIVANFKTLQHTLRGGRGAAVQREEAAAGAAALPAAEEEEEGEEDEEEAKLYRVEGKIYYSRAKMDAMFEAFAYSVVRKRNFSTMKSDDAVRKQCKMITAMLRELHCPVYILADEYETQVAKLDATARPSIKKLWLKRLECGSKQSARILLDSPTVLDLMWSFFSEQKFYKCDVDDRANISAENFFRSVAEAKVPLPAFGYLHEMLARMGTKAFRLNMDFLMFIKSDFSRTPREKVFKKWRKLARAAFPATAGDGKLKNNKATDSGWDHIFCYMLYSNWQEENQDKGLRPGEWKDFEEELVRLAVGAPLAVSIGSSSSDGDDEESEKDDGGDSSSGSGATTTSSGDDDEGEEEEEEEDELRLLQRRRSEGAAMVKQKKHFRTETPPISNESLSTASTSTMRNGMLAQYKSDKVVGVALQSVGGLFKSTPPKDEGKHSNDVDKFIATKPVYSFYQHLIKWLKDHHKVAQRQFQNVEAPVVYVKLVVQVWVETEKQILELKEEFRKGFSTPATLFAGWGKTADAPVRSSSLPVSLDAVLKATFQYCWESLPLDRVTKDTNWIKVLDAWKDVPYSTKEGFYNGRGIVVHLFNDDFGLIQTKFGRVLFERNICWSWDLSEDAGGGGGGGSWKRCKNACMALPKGSLVKLHAQVARFKVKKSSPNVHYLLATKVWACNGEAEPQSGITVLGRDNYWKACVGEFEKIVKSNTNLRFLPSRGGCAFDTDYRKAFSSALKERHGKLLLEKKSSGDYKDELPREDLQVFRSYDQFNASVASSSDCEEIVWTTKQMSTKGISFFSVRKAGLLHSLINNREQFEQVVEIWLFSMLEAADSSDYVAPQVCDIAPLLAKFLWEHDRGFEGQLAEYRKMFQKEKEGSLSHLESLFVSINKLILSMAESEVPAAAAAEEEQPVVGEEEKAVPEGGGKPGPASTDKVSNKSKVAASGGDAAAKAGSPVSDVVIADLSALKKRVKELEDWKRCREQSDVDSDAMLGTILKKLEELQSSAKFREHSSSSSAKAGGRSFVCVAIDADNAEPYEFPTDSSGNLNFHTVASLLPGVNALKYRFESMGRKSIRLCYRLGDIFEQPEDGWQARTYIANFTQPEGSEGIASAISNGTLPPPGGLRPSAFVNRRVPSFGPNMTGIYATLPSAFTSTLPTPYSGPR